MPSSVRSWLARICISVVSAVAIGATTSVRPVRLLAPKVTVDCTAVVGEVRSKVPVMPVRRSSVMVPNRGPKLASLNGAPTGSSWT